MSYYDWQWVEENPQTALEIINDLERENAALREENAVLRRGNERLIKTARDVLESFVLHKKVETGHPCPENMVICAELRAALDAARKEGQP